MLPFSHLCLRWATRPARAFCCPQTNMWFVRPVSSAMSHSKADLGIEAPAHHPFRREKERWNGQLFFFARPYWVGFPKNHLNSGLYIMVPAEGKIYCPKERRAQGVRAVGGRDACANHICNHLHPLYNIRFLLLRVPPFEPLPILNAVNLVFLHRLFFFFSDLPRTRKEAQHTHNSSPHNGTRTNDNDTIITSARRPTSTTNANADVEHIHSPE